jgi:peptide/nickel transport system substrate-binding protein
MLDIRGQRPGRTITAVTTFLMSVVALMVSCRGDAARTSTSSPAVLRIGWGQASATNPLSGLRQVSALLVAEGLARTGEDGRMLPSMAESWTSAADGRSLTAKLRPNMQFHDGVPADADAVVSLLPKALRAFMGPLYSEITSVRAIGKDAVAIAFRERSPFLSESLEAPLQKANGAATGPFKPEPNSPTELVANNSYYLGQPNIQRIKVESFPSIRTAWAELLRGQIDMLYEVGTDALPSLQSSNTVTVFTVNRRYQYVIALNPKVPALAPAAVRRALSLSVDRPALVSAALNGFGVASQGVIWPRHWAVQAGLPRFEFDPAAASAMLKRPIHFRCLIPPDAMYERIGLEVKRQLSAVGVEMDLEQVSFDELNQRGAKGEYDAMLIEAMSGPTLFRPYVFWHSTGAFNWGHFGTGTSDAALDRVRNAQSEAEYRDAVAGLQQTFMDDPPAIFLAWSQRARAVSKRFIVPAAEPGRDILSTLRLWKPASDAKQASRN